MKDKLGDLLFHALLRAEKTGDLKLVDLIKEASELFDDLNAEVFSIKLALDAFHEKNTKSKKIKK